MNAPTETTRTVILAAVDNTSFGGEVLRAGANLARASRGGELHLVYVAENLPPPAAFVPPPEGLGVTRAEMLVAARRFLDEAASAARAQFAGRLVVHLAAGVAWKEILQVAADVEADTILVGTHGRSGIKRFLLGSVAEAVVRSAACQVIVVRPKAYRMLGSPDVDPPCPDCLRAQRDSNGQRPTCAPHADDERRGRIYEGESRESA